MQLFIVFAYRRDRISADVEIGVVYLSLVTSCIVLFLWSIVLSIEARGYGLRFYEYITVVLQGSFNFVPYLPAIERGKRHKVNWTNFRFDSHSVGLVSKALISPDCKLQQIKMSPYSIGKLTRHECKFLGQMLADSPTDTIKVVFSRNRKEIEGLFNEFDTDNSRSFDFAEFVQLCSSLRQNDDGVVSAKDVASIFSVLADSKKHEVYLTDLLWKINKSVERLPVVDYDSPVLYALKSKDVKLLTFMMSAKVCDDVTWEYYTTTLVQTNRHEDALMMCEERGIPIVVELISGHNLPAHDFEDEDDPSNGTSDPYVSVSVGEKVKRTETIMKNLNPKWRQPLLFVLNPEEIPETLGGGLGDDISSIGGLSGMSKKRSAYEMRHRQNSFGGGHKHHGHHHHHKHHGHGHNPQGGQHGFVGSAGLNRLEINFKIYDYDEIDDDFFMGSYKHKINWTKQALEEHQNGSNEPMIYDKPLSGQNAGSFKFKIYTGTLQHYIKWGRNKK